MSRTPLWVHHLGRVEYEDGLELQSLFGRARTQGEVPDVLLLLEHPPVLTLGRGAKRENVVATGAQLERAGVTLHETNRGGDVTYHGPGQLVGYPILQLSVERQDVRRYVRDIEETLIRTVAHFGVRAHREPKWPGVWVGGEGGKPLEKIAAIGVHLSRWQTSHGFALNINTRLEHFGLIVPCGIREAGVTSLERELGRPLQRGDVEWVLTQAFAEVFDAEVCRPPALRETVAVAAVRADGKILCLKRSEARGGHWQLVTGTVEDGEGVLPAAQRELCEETGLWGAEVVPLDYRHVFALGGRVPPELCEESAFAVRWPEGLALRPSDEHVDHQWLTSEEAEALLPFAGLRVTVRRALERLGV